MLCSDSQCPMERRYETMEERLTSNIPTDAKQISAKSQISLTLNVKRWKIGKVQREENVARVRGFI